MRHHARWNSGVRFKLEKLMVYIISCCQLSNFTFFLILNFAKLSAIMNSSTNYSSENALVSKDTSVLENTSDCPFKGISSMAKDVLFNI